jgi:hypothetical protein
MAAAIVVAGGGCGRVAKKVPEVGGESHFLHWCSGSCDEEGLECISGLCTQPCIVAEPNSCAPFSAASCTAHSIEPGAVGICDVACASDADCAVLGSDYRCRVSFCRAPQRGAVSLTPPDVRRSAGGAPGTDQLASAGASGSLGMPTEPYWESLTWQDTTKQLGPGDGRSPQSTLSGCVYSHRYRLEFYWDAPPAPCNVQLDCSLAELAAVNALLREPFFNVAPAGGGTLYQSFGSPLRDDFGVLVQLYPPDRAFWAGIPCKSDESCSESPPIFNELLELLDAIDAIALADPACAAYAPGADAGPPVTGL